MAKIKIKQIADFSKEHWKEIVAIGGPVIKAGKELNEFISEKMERNEVKMHFRKARYIEYKKEILKNLHSKNRLELLHYKLEIEQFIQQIHSEQDIKVNVKKPVHNKRINNWQSILIQIEERINLKDYQEYLRIYNNPEYNSEYFKGNEKLMNKYRKIVSDEDQQELLKFLLRNTSISKAKIKMDFFME